MNIQKQGTAQCAGMPTEQQMAKINELAKTPLQAQEVYVFSVRLCDDLPDRDFERFDTQALGVLAEMFVGKTGIIDHEWSSNNQIARIFETYVEKDGKASFITAWAYMLRNAATQPMIDDIEGGIRKEVSVGCAMQRAVCSICGREYGTCEHRKGQQYDQEICVAVLCQPTDAYEFSFVAVPAQRYAGVQKQWKGGEAVKKLKDFVEQSGDIFLMDELSELQKQADLGQSYAASLRKDVCRLAMVLDLGVQPEVMQQICETLPCEQLLALRKALAGKEQELFPGKPQLPGDVPAAGSHNTSAYMI